MIDDQDWDETETEEQREARLVEWLKTSRAVWLIFNDAPYFMGVWEIEADYDEDTGMMLLQGLPDWPEARYEQIETHILQANAPADKYEPEHREHAFSNVMAIRPVETPIERRRQGDKTILSLDQEPRIIHLRLYGKLDDF